MYETNEICRDYSVEFAEKCSKQATYSNAGTGINFTGIDAYLFNLSEFCCVKIVTFIHGRSFETFEPRLFVPNLPKSAEKGVSSQDSTEWIGHLRQKRTDC